MRNGARPRADEDVDLVGLRQTERPPALWQGYDDLRQRIDPMAVALTETEVAEIEALVKKRRRAA